MPEATERALLLVGLENAFPKSSLVQTLTHDRGDVLPSTGVLWLPHHGPAGLGLPVCLDVAQIIDGDAEHQVSRTVTDDEDRPDCHVPTGYDGVQIDERRSFKHRPAETGVLRVIRVGPSIAVQHQAVGAHLIIVRTVDSCGDRERDLAQHARLEDALLRHERDALTVDLEPV